MFCSGYHKLARDIPAALLQSLAQVHRQPSAAAGAEPLLSPNCSPGLNSPEEPWQVGPTRGTYPPYMGRLPTRNSEGPKYEGDHAEPAWIHVLGSNNGALLRRFLDPG